ncbi:ABC transporter ATP-binding protein [Teredinibacter purpureus]|uniref:ABC transporter ATP-binding protein n=1 Tax=Teredinibacter purpureus TaxID=2731756 RepID=UPI000B09AF07|nr:ABC transporter ATP-binding protein [Teredinibacter purpureus]
MSNETDSHQPMIEVKNVWKQYDDNVVLEHVNIAVEEGEFVTLVGASGCGKSTFLNMLLGTVQPSKGQILLYGQPIPEEPGPDRGIVFQQYSVFPHMTVLENVMATRGFQRKGLTGYLFGAAKVAAEKDAKAMLNQVGLDHALNQYPDELSGGMKQRLAIAQALLSKPRVLLLDEPFGALDPGIRADMHELVLNLWREHKLTIFMVTHDLKEGFYLGTRLWVFDKSRHDPHAPNRYGAGITYDLPVGKVDPSTYEKIDNELRPITEHTIKESA